MSGKTKKVVRQQSRERQRSLRERRREAGLVQLEVWVLPEDVELVKQLRDRAVASLTS